MTSAKEKSRDEDGEVQDLAVLKLIKRAAESDEKKRAARLEQQEIFIVKKYILFIHKELRSP